MIITIHHLRQALLKKVEQMIYFTLLLDLRGEQLKNLTKKVCLYFNTIII